MQLPPELYAVVQQINAPTVLPSTETIDGEERCCLLAVLLRAEIDSARGDGIFMRLEPVLGLTPYGAVFRLDVTVYDTYPPLKLYCWLDPLVAYDRKLLQDLTRQTHMAVHFFAFDAAAEYSHTQQFEISQVTRTDLARMLRQAKLHNRRVPLLDFSHGKECVVAQLEAERTG